MSKKLKSIRIFISSPGDVAEERALTRKVIERLQGEFSGRVILEPIYWEHEPLLATQSFQEQIIRPSETDIVITILWSRLGTRLPVQFTKADGSRYESGTEFEFEDAIQSFRDHGTPDLLIYRKTADPQVSLKDKKVLFEKLKQKESLDNFFDKWFHDKTEGTIIAAFHPFANSADFEEIFESHLSKLIKSRLPRPDKSDKTPAFKPQWKEGSPFRGLNVFNFEHSPVFFGRTKAVSEIMDALRIQAISEKAFILILGMSGGGKSSLVRAGLLPMITLPGVIEGVGLWRRAIMKPGDSSGDMFDGLAACLLHKHALPELGADRTGFKELAKILRETPKAVVPLIKGGLSQAASEMAKSDLLKEQPTARLVLLVDQMEEMFSLESITHEERIKFIEALDALSRSGRVWVIATLRSDFYPRTTELEGLVALKEGAGQYDLLAPTSAEIGQMIRQPAQAAGLYYEEDSSTNERLDDVLRDAASKNPGALPLLEFTLEELYKQRTDNGMLTYEAYKVLGGVEGALAQRAEEVFGGLEPKVQQAMDVELHSLISIGVDDGERISRKYAPLEIATATPETKAFVEAFVKARLFTTDLAADGSAIVNIAHEALLQNWPRLQNWIEKNRENLRIHARVASATIRWEKENKSREFLLSAGKQISEAEELVKNKCIKLTETEKKFVHASIAKRRRIWWIKRAIAAVLVILTIVTSGAAYLAMQERDRAETEARTSEQVSDFLVGLFEVSDPNEALGDTISVREILDKGAERIENELSDQPEIQATLMSTMGVVYLNLGLYDKAIALLENAVNIRTRLSGEKNLYVASSIDYLAQANHNRGDYNTAEQLYKKSLEIRKTILGYNDSVVATSLNNLASLFGSIGKYDSAEILYREALEIEKELFGLERIQAAITLINLGNNLNTMNKYKESKQLIQQGIDIARKKDGDESIHVASGLRILAVALNCEGRYSEAEAAFLEALEINKKVFGKEHDQYLVTLHNYSGLLTDMGKYSEADSIERIVIQIYKKLYGDDHPNIAVMLHNFGLGLLNQNKYEEAEPILLESLEICSNFFEPDDWRLILHKRSVGLCYYKQKRYSEAEPLFVESYPIFKAKFGEENNYTRKSLEFIIGLYKAWDKPEKVAEYEAFLPDTIAIPEAQ